MSHPHLAATLAALRASGWSLPPAVVAFVDRPDAYPEEGVKARLHRFDDGWGVTLSDAGEGELLGRAAFELIQALPGTLRTDGVGRLGTSLRGRHLRVGGCVVRGDVLRFRYALRPTAESLGDAEALSSGCFPGDLPDGIDAAGPVLRVWLDLLPDGGHEAGFLLADGRAWRWPVGGAAVGGQREEAPGVEERIRWPDGVEDSWVAVG